MLDDFGVHGSRNWQNASQDARDDSAFVGHAIRRNTENSHD